MGKSSGVFVGYRGSASERFWAKVRQEGECWVWTGAKNNGYGRFRVRPDLAVAAHRFAYEYMVAPIPDGLVIDHLCRNSSCVNPEHLEPVRQRENIRRSPTAPPGIRMRQTHCIRGHELAGPNLYVTPSTGYRACRKCQAMRARRRSRAS